MAAHIPKGMGRLIERYWSAIDTKVTQALRSINEPVGTKRYHSALEHVDFRHDMFGAGMWGVPYPTASKHWIVKITSDPTEGPITRLILKTTALRRHPAISYFLRLWKLAEQTQDRGKSYPVYVILREAIDPRDPDVLLKHNRPAESRAEDLLVGGDAGRTDQPGMRDTAHFLNVAKAEGDEPERQRLLELFIEQVDALERLPPTYLMADFIAEFYYHSKGGALADLHLGNVGYRRHTIPSSVRLPAEVLASHHRSDSWVIFDPGHSELTKFNKLAARGIPTIPWHANPAEVSDIPIITR